MTKEELARKKGKKLEKNKISAAESLIINTTQSITEEKKDEAPTEVIEESKENAENIAKKEEEPQNKKDKEQIKIENLVKEEIEETKKEIKKTKKESAENQIKTGRPKGVDTAKVSINVPIESLKLINIAAGVFYKGNVTNYINTLIEKDIEENGEMYKKIIKMANNK